MAGLHFSNLLSSAAAQACSVLDRAGDALFLVGDGDLVVHASSAAQALLDGNPRLRGVPVAELVHPDAVAELQAAMTLARSGGVATSALVRLHAAREIWLDFRILAVAGVAAQSALVLVGRDVSEQRIEVAHLRKLAMHDALTRLPNRVLLNDRLKMAVAAAQRTRTGFAVLALDLDGFKKVNDGLGHAAGDVLLCMAGARLRAVLRDVDTLSRTGGDEFVVVLPNVISELGVRTTARRLQMCLQAPFELGGCTAYVGTSIGAAIYPDHGADEAALLDNADTALYRAKSAGRGVCVVYVPEAGASKPANAMSLEAAMYEGVRNGEFWLAYQPIVDGHSRQTRGYEALMRWTRPDGGIVSPADFIPLAEANGLISLLGAWALKSACLNLKQFQVAAGRALYMSVNVSPSQLGTEAFTKGVETALQVSTVLPEHLMLEITEGALMVDPQLATRMLGRLAERGVQVAVDDFGTGQSSLAFLKGFALTTLKVDRAFIDGLPDSQTDVAICTAILGLARALGKRVVAEGVETEGQLQALLGMGVALMQGFYLGRPAPPQQIIAQLMAERARLPEPALAGTAAP